MIPVSSAAISGGLNTANLTWSRRSRGYELKFNDTVAGTLEQPSFWSCKIVATTRTGSWLFRRAGFFNTGAEILDAATQQLVATLKNSWGGPATLSFADGQTFLIKARGLWHPVWSITTEDGRAVLQSHKREKRVEVANEAGITDDRLTLLKLFALYRIWQAEQDASAAAVVATS